MDQTLQRFFQHSQAQGFFGFLLKDSDLRGFPFKPESPKQQTPGSEASPRVAGVRRLFSWVWVVKVTQNPKPEQQAIIPKP